MLSIRNLSKTYANGVRAIDDVNLEIGQGLFGLLGPNGAGKSSLMRTIAGLQAPDSGSIHFDDTDIVADRPAVRRVLGYLPQEFGVYPRMSAQAMLDHFAILKGLTDRRARKAEVAARLEQTNLYEVRKKPVASFSGGMKRRFGIAQALLGNPALIIVDEPTAGLDPSERNRFNRLLARLGEQAVVLLSTHIVDDVANLCSRMAIMGGGRILRLDSPQRTVGELRGLLWRKRATIEELAEQERHWTPIATKLSGGHTWIWVRAETKPGEDFESVEPRLEDAYFETLRRHGLQAS
ncbi:ABC transporter ATP-binding protein [Sulfidibacter corallicola]|uniref:ABC transporter ATP-binding protein n=1 Tax=Sulfidibacter corallicola TaxID=2818388 RepID=A0A8A4TVP5_SULCO|nr:ABC transporter ATP-binding protein [Sulfidibacter corallicola]QTD50605.1 ABC transporter ATP-binding protein [Sulfidibacter corallicola]